MTVYPIGVERKYLSRNEAIKRTLKKLRFFHDGPEGKGTDAIGYRGFYYHFLDMKTGHRTWNSEVSTIDTAFLLAGALTAAQYFDRETKDEREIRVLADALYRRADWHWARNGALTVTLGWKPETGFIKYRWTGYSEALILYVLALASPTFPLPAESYRAWTRTYKWTNLYGHEFLYAGPLFIHQLSHMWIDFRGIQDEYMRGKQSTISKTPGEQSTPSNNTPFAIQKDSRVTASTSGESRRAMGQDRQCGESRAAWCAFMIMLRAEFRMGRMTARLPRGPSLASLPFAPEIVLPSLNYFNQQFPEMTSHYGFKCSYNPTFADAKKNKNGWVSLGYYGLDQGPIVAMIENYRTGFLWRLMRNCPYIVEGLRRAGFKGGWIG